MEPVEISVEEMAEFAVKHAKEKGVELTLEQAMIAFEAEDLFLEEKGLISYESSEE